MDTFVSRFPALVTGVLSGFDRLVFRGHLTRLRIDGGDPIAGLQELRGRDQ